MPLKKRIGKNGVEYEYIAYDRDAKATFLEYSAEQLIELRTLMRHVGGIKKVAFELYKQENGLSELQKVTVHYKSIIIHGKDGNPDRSEILIANELLMLQKKYREDNNGEELNYTLTGEDFRSSNIRVHFFNSPGKVMSYKTRVNNAFNYNVGSNKDTHIIVNIINRMAMKLNVRKEKSVHKIQKWLIPKEMSYEEKQSKLNIKSMVDSINSIPISHETTE